MSALKIAIIEESWHQQSNCIDNRYNRRIKDSNNRSSHNRNQIELWGTLVGSHLLDREEQWNKVKESRVQQGESQVMVQEREMRGEEKNLKGSTGYQAGTLNGLRKIAGSTDSTAPSKNIIYCVVYFFIFVIIFYFYSQPLKGHFPCQLFNKKGGLCWA